MGSTPRTSPVLFTRDALKDMSGDGISLAEAVAECWQEGQEQPIKIHSARVHAGGSWRRTSFDARPADQLNWHPELKFVYRVAAHIGAAGVDDDGRMLCPNCSCWEFGPEPGIGVLRGYVDGYLPGAPGCHGICIDCEHQTYPVEDQGLWA